MTDNQNPYEAAKHFYLGNITSCDCCKNGHINCTYIIKTDDSCKYVLQAVNKNVFKDPEALMQNIVRVSEHLKKKVKDRERNALNIIQSDNGRPLWYDKYGTPWRVYRFVPNTVCLNSCNSAEQFYKVGKAFGTFQRQLEDFDVSQLSETIPHFHDTEKRYNDFLKAVNEDVACHAAEVSDEIVFVKEHVDKATVITHLLSQGLLPMRVTHNDAKLNNIMLDPVSGDGVCVIDLDTVMPGSILYDFGDAVRFGASNCPEDETDENKVFFNADMFKACLKGFSAPLESVLTEDEKRLLPLGVYTMTFETGMRFLTDYLNKDTYFHTEYSGQNLDRAHNQFCLVRDLEKRKDEFSLTFK